MVGNKDTLANYLKRAGVLRSPQIIRAFESTNRADFLPDSVKDEWFIDAPLPIGYGQTNSQPYTVAFMLELLHPQTGDKVLDVGAGSGWTTALLAHAVGPEGEVIGVELVPELVEFARQNLAKYKFKNARIEQAGKQLGKEVEAPFKRILVSAAASEMPQDLLNQLADGGTMVIPIGGTIYRIRRKGFTIEEERYEGYAFVPLIGGKDDRNQG